MTSDRKVYKSAFSLFLMKEFEEGMQTAETLYQGLEESLEKAKINEDQRNFEIGRDHRLDAAIFGIRALYEQNKAIVRLLQYHFEGREK